MIVTVSPNIALDRVRVIRGFEAGRQSRALFEFLQPGGSGVHATDVIQSLGGESIAVGLLGGHASELWKLEAHRRQLRYDMVPIPGETRESFCLVDLDLGSVVESVTEGPRVDPGIKDVLVARVESYLHEAELLILSGSLPPGLPDSTYADLIALAARHGVPVLADIHSEPLKKAIPLRPWLLKPNLSEFHELIGDSTQTLPDRVQASHIFCQRTGIILALSMSEAGVLLTTPEEQWLLTPPPTSMHLPDGLGRNVIGCGDALVGALAYEYCRTRDILGATRLGLAAAHFNLSTPGVPEIHPAQVWDLVKQVGVQRLSI
ncbi:MAG: 1-phosphofructokinase family hexose kinase [Syntrophothermus sp.]